MTNENKAITAYFDFETYNLTDYKFGEEPIENWDKLLSTDKPVAVYGAGLWWEGKAYTWFGLDALDKFWTKLKALGQGKLITLIAHNCGYDFAFLNEYLHTNGHSKIKSFKAAQTDDDRAWLWAEIEVDGLNIQFKDTWVWDKNCSLGYYSDILQTEEELQKGKLEHYEKWNFFEKDGEMFFYDKDGILRELDLEAERKYLINDICLLPKVRDYIFDTKKKILGTDLIPEEQEWQIYNFSQVNGKITKASFAKTCFELCLGEYFHEGFKVPISAQLYYLQEKSYIGGFTAGNKYITALDLDEAKIKSYDVNSLYPSIMAGYLPYGDISYDKITDKPYCEWFEITGTFCRYKEKYNFLDCPIISTKFEEWLEEKNEHSFLDGTFLILKEYYQIINEFCEHDLKVVNILYQELTNKLSRFIVDAYNLRVLVKKGNNKDKALADSIKLFLNSGYGKFGEKVHTYIIEWDEEKKCWREDLAKKCDYYTSLLTGLYVCSQGRIKLMKAIKTEVENGNTFLYSDTDSLKIVENNPVKLEVDPDKLGAWKDEGAFNIWRYPLKRKRYYCKNTFTGDEKITCGGFSKYIIEDLTYEDKLKFFSPDINVVIKNGKKARFIGDVHRRRKDKEAVLNKFGLTKLYRIDISTTNKLQEPDYIVEQNSQGTWVMRKADEKA